MTDHSAAFWLASIGPQLERIAAEQAAEAALHSAHVDAWRDHEPPDMELDRLRSELDAIWDRSDDEPRGHAECAGRVERAEVVWKRIRELEGSQ